MSSAFEDYGHYVSKIDPLDLQEGKNNFEEITDFFSLETSGIDKEFWDIELDFNFKYKEEGINTIRKLH